MDFTSLIVQLIAGAVGGNAGGAAVKNASLGPIGNSIAGALGGLGGGSLLGPLIAGADPSMLSNLVGGGVGGIILQVVAGFIKNSMNKTA